MSRLGRTAQKPDLSTGSMVNKFLTISFMRRSLVLTDETARHPFLAQLPPHVRNPGRPEKAAIRRGIAAQDVREFLLAYCACFMAVSLYIA